MELLNMGRGLGKTYRLMIESHLTNCPILTCNETAKNNIIEMAKKMNINIPEPLSVTDVFNNKYNSKQNLIDDADYVLQHLTSANYNR